MSVFEKGSLIPANKRILFLGDSITVDGRYIGLMDYYLKKYQPDHDIELINLGLGSETASGLSEPSHPFPRPCVLDRIDQVLELTKSEWVVICYGINDGIYYPYSEERMEAYQKGIRRLVGKIKADGAKVVVMTPPPFDNVSFVGKLWPDDREEYSWMDAYEGYNGVIKRYRDWIVTDLRSEVDYVIDIFTPITIAINAKREKDPFYRTGDGIHPDLEGHWIMARCLLAEIFHIYPEFEPEYIEKLTSAVELVMKRHNHA